MKIPKIIKLLILADIWPKRNLSNHQEFKSFINMENIKRLIPDEEYFHFFAPPFLTIYSRIKLDNSIYSTPEIIDSLKQIDINKAVIIGDFGYDSDTELVLDYRKGDDNPSVIRLKWEYYDQDFNKRSAKWVKVSENLEKLLDIDEKKIARIIDDKVINLNSDKNRYLFKIK